MVSLEVWFLCSLVGLAQVLFQDRLGLAWSWY